MEASRHSTHSPVQRSVYTVTENPICPRLKLFRNEKEKKKESGTALDTYRLGKKKNRSPEKPKILRM